MARRARRARPKAKAEAKAAAGRKARKQKRKQPGKDAEALCSFAAGEWTGTEFSSPSDSAGGLECIVGHSIVAAGDRIWCLGGWRGRVPVSQKMSVLELRLESKSWVDATPCDDVLSSPCWRWGHSSCLVSSRHPAKPAKHYVWVAGGFNSFCNLNEVWRFSPAEGRFSRVPSEFRHLPYRAGYHSLVFDDVAKQLLLFGGQCCVGGPYKFFDSVPTHLTVQQILRAWILFILLMPTFLTGGDLQRRGVILLQLIRRMSGWQATWGSNVVRMLVRSKLHRKSVAVRQALRVQGPRPEARAQHAAVPCLFAFSDASVICSCQKNSFRS